MYANQVSCEILNKIHKQLLIKASDVDPVPVGSISF